MIFNEFSHKQECIPVGCVPSAEVAVSAPGGGGYLVPGGVPAGGYLPGAGLARGWVYKCQ